LPVHHLHLIRIVNTGRHFFFTFSFFLFFLLILLFGFQDQEHTFFAYYIFYPNFSYQFHILIFSWVSTLLFIRLRLISFLYHHTASLFYPNFLVFIWVFPHIMKSKKLILFFLMKTYFLNHYIFNLFLKLPPLKQHISFQVLQSFFLIFDFYLLGF
jgi:hypothetical protein